jgi:hypothetical protein
MGELQLHPKISRRVGSVSAEFACFGEDVHEFMAPVVGEANDRLGVILYGFSNRRSLEATKAARSAHAGAEPGHF